MLEDSTKTWNEISLCQGIEDQKNNKREAHASHAKHNETHGNAFDVETFFRCALGQNNGVWVLIFGREPCRFPLGIAPLLQAVKGIPGARADDPVLPAPAGGRDTGVPGEAPRRAIP